MSSCTSVHIFLSPVVVAFLLCSALQVVTSTGICSEAESRLQCRGRCAAASKVSDRFGYQRVSVNCLAQS